MKGGLSKRVSKKKSQEITFNEFALHLIRDSIISNLPIITKKYKQSGGNFVSDFNSWLKTEAEPVHDFKRKHEVFDKSISEKLLIRTYHDILTRNTSDFENSILIKILQDPNLPQGISLKFCRFYKLNDEQSLWEKIEKSFDALDENSRLKFYLLNAPISGTGSRDFTNEYIKIVPLSAYWDPFKSSGVNFTILNDDEFYNKIYNEINKELYIATKIGFQINQGETEKQIILSLAAPNGIIVNYTLDRQGFSVDEIKTAIDELSNSVKISNDDLRHMITFLKNNDASTKDIISFLLVCKMSGDIGCVYFLKEISKYNGNVKFNKSEIDFNVQNKPIMFLYTIDRLCGSCAISNDVKCVIKYKPIVENEAYICQYVGSKGTLDESVFEPYYSIISQICGYDFRTLTSQQKNTELSKIYYRQFNAKFPGLMITPETNDDIIRYLLAIISLNDLEKNLTATIKYIVNHHLKKQKLNATMFSLGFLKSFYTHLQTDNFFDPLLQYFMSTLIIPNESIQKHIYNVISNEIKKHIGIELTDNYKMLTVLRESPEKNVATFPEEKLDMGMTDAVVGESSKKQKPKKEIKKKKKSSSESEYVPSEESD